MKCFGRLFALLSVSIILSSVALAQTLKFHLTDLGTMNGYQSVANAINNSGQVVGDYWMSNGDQRCFLYRGGAWQDVAIGRGSPQFCDAKAINDIGQIAGLHKAAVPGNPSYAFRLDPPAGLTDLKPLQGTNSSGWGISPSGVVVGYMDTPSGTSHAARWDPSGIITDLSTSCPNCWSGARAINPAGIIVGWINYFTATTWDRRGRMNTLPSLGGKYNSANAVNANGDIVGESTRSSDEIAAALWQGGSVIDLGVISTPGVSWETYATAISIDKWIVGTSMSNQAFLVVPDPGCGDIHDLTALLDSSGAGWNLGSANGINDQHQIVGWGWSPDGGVHAFLLTPNQYPLCYPS